MRKNDLINLLSGIQGNPEVMLWNGLVGDVVPIKKEVANVSLMKEKLDKYINGYRYELKIDTNNVNAELDQDELNRIKRQYNKIKYEYLENIGLDYTRYKKKNIVVLQAEEKGETYFDRLGSVKY
jgi:hypothetical protein